MCVIQFALRNRTIMHFKSFILLLIVSFCWADKSPEVDTYLGKVKGYVKTSLGGRKFAAFEGIPYAKPPVGDLRFKDPEPVEGWKGVWDATVGHECIQYGKELSDKITGNEDCLYLNVYVPLDKLNTFKKLDVIVHIHGGAFMMGSATGHFNNPDLLMDRDVIFVTLNYRLGILGFLSTGDGVISGNFGLKDQVLALEWIKKHISKFGGNSESITLTGLSAGGASVHFHLLSSMSKGLFHRAFSESGTALNPWALQHKPGENAKKLAHLVGCVDHFSKYILSCLKQVPAKLLLSKLDHFYEYSGFPVCPFSPVIESVSAPNRFLTRHPISLYVEQNVIDVPWLVSTTADEGIFPGVWLWPVADDLESLWPKISAYVLDYNQTLAKSQWEIVAQKIKEQYIGKNEKLSKSNFKQVIKMLTDRLFVNGVETAIRRQSKVNKSPVYYFNFGHQSKDISPFEIPGAFHGISAVFLYGSKEFKYTESDKQLINILLDMLVSFAKTGVPEIKGVQWDPVKSSDITYLNISSPNHIQQQTQTELTPKVFWKSLNILENEHVVLVKDEL